MSLLRVSLALALTLGADAAAQAVIGAPCDPSLRDPSQGNLNGCTGALRCRWVTGTCVVTERFTGVELVNLDRQCLDDPNRGEATATTPFWADCSICTGVTGQCEELDVCNADRDCLVRDHRCIDGLCQFAPEPASLPGGGCTNDAGCRAQGAQFRCVSGVCVQPEKMAGWNTHDARVGFKSASDFSLASAINLTACTPDPERPGDDLPLDPASFA